MELPNRLTQGLEELVKERELVRDKERALVDQLNTALPRLGYKVVPVSRRGRPMRATAAETQPELPKPARRKALARMNKRYKCPYCLFRSGDHLALARHVKEEHPRPQRKVRQRKRKAAS